MSEIPGKKLPQSWHTKSFHQARLWMGIAFALFILTDAFLRSELPSQIALIMLPLVDLAAIYDWRRGRPEMQPLIPVGNSGAKQQFQKLRWSLMGMIGGYAGGIASGYLALRSSHSHPLYFVALLIFANVGGWFLCRWLGEVYLIVQQIRSGVCSTTTMGDKIVSTTAASAYNPPANPSHAQRLRAGNGGRP